jgi:putative transcriptional regulator
MASVKVKVDGESPRKGKTDFARVRSLSEEEINRRALSDPDSPPLRAEELSEMERVPDVKAIRDRLHLSQAEFSRRFRLSLKTVQDWEQGRFEPDQASRTLLRLIEKIPHAVQEALAEPKRTGTRG